MELNDDHLNSALVDIAERLQRAGKSIRNTDMPTPQGPALHLQPQLIQRERSYNRETEADYVADNLPKANEEQADAVQQILASLNDPCNPVRNLDDVAVDMSCRHIHDVKSIPECCMSAYG